MNAFHCNCKLAISKGSTSCLDAFTKAELRGIYAETYGTEDEAAADKEEALSDGVHLGKVTQQLLIAYCSMKVPAKKRRSDHQLGNLWEFNKWKLLEKQVCYSAWKKARGGADRRHRTLSKCKLFDSTAPNPVPNESNCP